MGSCATTQNRRRSLGQCVVCAVPAPNSATYCETHRQQRNLYQRERKRRKLGCRRRYLNAESYMFTATKKSIYEQG